MKSSHQVIFKDSRQLSDLPDECIDLVVTSPPYPMIEMWDDIFSHQNTQIGKALKKNDARFACELMHQELDRVWDEVYRVLKDGGIACINIGDATRTIDGRFTLYTNHSRVHTYMQQIGFTALPAILWRKQTNAPNKFMGSGMMPPNAYVTLEHEYVLILRKGNRKAFKTHIEKTLRRESSFFWEERNIWFSDVWMDLKGATQNLFSDKARERSGTFPFELAYRLITMFSVKIDTVLDPFLGIGTTMYASMAAGRNSIGYEIDVNLRDAILSNYAGIIRCSNRRIDERLTNHLAFVEERYQKTGKFKYTNKHYLFPVMTRQETDLIINALTSVKMTGDNAFEVTYSEKPQERFVGFLHHDVMPAPENDKPTQPAVPRKYPGDHIQQQLFK